MASEGNSAHLPLQQEGSQQKGCLASPWSRAQGCRGGWASGRTSKQTARKRSQGPGRGPGAGSSRKCLLWAGLPPAWGAAADPAQFGRTPALGKLLLMGGLMATACLVQTWIPASQARTPKSFAPSLAGHCLLWATPTWLLQLPCFKGESLH